MATVWQRPHLWVNDWRSAPIELMRPLRQYGYRVVEIHLKDAGEVPWSYCEQLRNADFLVMGAFWCEGDPVLLAEWAVYEVNRLILNGIIPNAEDNIEAEDQAGNKWSEKFCKRFRSALTGRPMALNTYTGCGGLDMQAWRNAYARLYLQTGRAGQPFAESVPDQIKWAEAHGWARSRTKPCFGVYKGFDGEFANVDSMIASAKAAKTIGFSAYYADGADLGEPQNILAPLATKGIAEGIAR